jgi:hypothetical protein
MHPSISFLLISCMTATFSMALAQADTMPPGRYEAKTLGDDGEYKFVWVLKDNGNYEIKMTCSAENVKKSHMRGKYTASRDSVYLKENTLKDEKGWQPYPNDAYATTRINDSTYHVVFMQDNEADFVLKTKDQDR